MDRLQTVLTNLYTKHFIKHDTRLEKEEHPKDTRWKLTMTELSGHPIPDDRWLSVEFVDATTGLYHIQCAHHGVFMGLVEFYLRKQIGSSDGCMSLWIDGDEPYRAKFACHDQTLSPVFKCTYKDHAAAVAAEAVLSLFGRNQNIDSKSVALPAYPPRKSQGLQWTIVDDYLVIPHPVQHKVNDTSATYAVRLPQTLLDDNVSRTEIRTISNMHVLGLQCPLTRTMLQHSWRPKPPDSSSIVSSSIVSSSVPSDSLNSSVVPVAPDNNILITTPSTNNNVTSPKPSLKRARDANESVYSEGQLRPKRLKSKASKLPFQVFLSQWSNAKIDVIPLVDKLDPEYIEAWCLLNQPRRSAIGEDRVMLLANRVRTETGALPYWFKPGV
jgi:hypothetical protein